jgi:DNA-binding GntR family transcriptional regulator
MQAKGRPVLPPLDGGSRGDRVAARLRQAITSGRYQPAERLVELELARQLGTSQQPIRDALRQLEQEGLVVSYPYRGTVVAEVSQEEIEEVLVPIRVVIERYAFACAAPELSDGDFAILGRFVADMRAAGQRRDADALADADVRFHEHVLIRSGQHHCLQLWRTVQPRVRAYFRRDAPGHTDPNDVAEQHQLLIDALRAADVARLDEVVGEHIHAFLPAPNTGEAR